MSDNIFIVQVVEESQGLLRTKSFPFKQLDAAVTKYYGLKRSFLNKAMDANNLWDKVTSLAYGNERVDEMCDILIREGFAQEGRATCADWDGSEEDYYFESIDVCNTLFLRIDEDTTIRMNIVIEEVK